MKHPTRPHSQVCALEFLRLKEGVIYVRQDSGGMQNSSHTTELGLQMNLVLLTMHTGSRV